MEQKTRETISLVVMVVLLITLMALLIYYTMLNGDVALRPCEVCMERLNMTCVKL